MHPRWQVIALLCHLVEQEGLSNGPFLVVVPASVLPNWASELARWAPGLRVATYAGPEPARAAVYQTQLRNRTAQVCLTTFEMVMNAKDVPRLSRVDWAYLVMDEVTSPECAPDTPKCAPNSCYACCCASNSGAPHQERGVPLVARAGEVPLQAPPAAHRHARAEQVRTRCCVRMHTMLESLTWHQMPAVL